MRRPAEAGEPQQLAVLQPGEGERPIPDGAGAEQRRRLHVREGIGDDAGVILAHGHELGVAAVDIPGRWPETPGSGSRQPRRKKHGSNRRLPGHRVRAC